MSKITSADCVQEIIKRCANPVHVLEAYAGSRDYLDPNVIQEALGDVYIDNLDPDNEESTPSLAQFAALVTDPKNWKRHSKRQDPEDRTITERVFNCVPFDDSLRAYVLEKGGKIVKVWIQGE